MHINYVIIILLYFKSRKEKLELKFLTYHYLIINKLISLQKIFLFVK